MAESKNPDNPGTPASDAAKQELQESEFVAKVVQDPSQPPSVTLLVGFPGKALKDGHRRLYLTPELKQYVEVPEEHIVHSQALAPDQSSLGAIGVWVRGEAVLQYTRVTSRQIQAEFLQGSIMRDFAPGSTGLATIAGRLAAPRRQVYSVDRPCASDAGSTCEDVCRHHGGGGGGGNTGFCTVAMVTCGGWDCGFQG